MKEYLYETHMHTSEISVCASATAVEQARLYKKLGYDGIIITDHFYNGNTEVPKDLPWEEWVNRFTVGYEKAKAEGDKIGLSVFFGWEESFHGNDFLVYGLDKEWLLDHPQIINWEIKELYENVNADGGYFVHAHPFREEDYIKEIRLFPNHVHAVEVINSSHTNPKFDKRAIEYAKKHGLAMAAGSDAHHVNDLKGGMVFNHKLESIEDFIDAMRAGQDYKMVRDIRELSYRKGSREAN